MKTCFKCDRSLPLDEFYAHPMMADGHLGKCKDCTKADVAANRQARLDEVRAYDRERAALPHRRELQRRVSEREYERDPRLRRARQAVANAIRSGALVRQPCEVCGTDQAVHGHHDDYDKPLDVRWLCAVHHAAAHLAYRVVVVEECDDCSEHEETF